MKNILLFVAWLASFPALFILLGADYAYMPIPEWLGVTLGALCWLYAFGLPLARASETDPNPTNQ